MTATTTLPTNAELRVLSHLRDVSGSDRRRADLVMVRALADVSDLDSLIEAELIVGVNELGTEMGPTKSWPSGLNAVYLRLTAKGRGWFDFSPHVQLLLAIGTAGSTRLISSRVRQVDEVLLDLLDRNLIVVFHEDGRNIKPRPAGAPSNQLPGQPLYAGLTRYGRAIVDA